MPNKKRTKNVFLKITLVRNPIGEKKILFELFASHKLINRKKIAPHQDLISLLDKEFKKAKIKPEAIKRLIVDCGQFQSSVTCRLLKVFKKTFRLVYLKRSI